MYCSSMTAAAIAWTIDREFCVQLHSLEIPGIITHIPNPQLHAVWHVLVAYSTYLSGIFVRVVRHIIINGKSPQIVWILGFWPEPRDHKKKGY